MKNNQPRLMDLFHLLILCLLLASLVGVPEPASALSYKFASPTGTQDDDCTYTDPCDLQTAVNTSSPGGLVYVAAGTYHPFSLPSDQVLLINQSVHIYGGWDGVSGGDPGIPDHETYITTLDGENARQVVTIMLDPTETATLTGLTIRNGNATGKTAICSAPSPAGCGGGILVTGGTTTIEHCIIEDNIAATTASESARTGFGGGIYIQNPESATIRYNTIRSNDASTAISGPAGNNGEGGGIFVSGAVDATDLTITQNDISENSAASSDFGGWGVGLTILDSHGVVSGNTFRANNLNLSSFGSGLYTWHSDLSIDDNLFINNLGGQALYLADFNGSLTSNTIINPEIGYGIFFGINGGGRSSLLVNNIIAHHDTANIAIAGGDGVISTVNGYHNTLDDAPYGLYLLNYASVIFANSILSNHTTGIYENPTGSDIFVNLSYTLFFGNISDGTWDLLVHPIPSGDPFFMNANANDYRIQANSAARDKAETTGYTYDFEGDPRPMGSGGTPYDVGADEFWWKITLPITVRP